METLKRKTPLFEARVYGRGIIKYVSLQWNRKGKFFSQQLKIDTSKSMRSIELKDEQAYLISIKEKGKDIVVKVIEDYLFAVEACDVLVKRRGNTELILAQ